MAVKLSDYIPIVGESIIEELRLLGKKLEGRVIQTINSTAVGGGVAEILNRMIPLLQELGVDAHWDVIKGGEDFFKVTKKIHNALHGRAEKITPKMYKTFTETSQMNIDEMDLYGDIILVHDPQPVMLVKKKTTKKAKWIWRCHIDVSNPISSVWDFIKPFVGKYDASVFSAPIFSQKLKIPQFLIPPSIDPLSDKNKELDLETINRVLKKYGIKKDRPIIAQISRYDYLKDPLGVIQAFWLVKKYIKCQLVLAGNRATDDPESEEVLALVREKTKGDPDIHVLLIPPEENDIDINALQSAATVIVQKSIREGFGLVVTEALWKAKPVVASAVGGISLQIAHKYGGLLCHTVEGAAVQIRQFLNSPEYAYRLGKNGKEHVKENFLLTRHLRDYMLLFLAVDRLGEDIVYL